MVKVLHIVSSLGGGGVEKMLLEYHSKLNTKYEFDFIVHGDNIGALEDEIRERGCGVFHVTPKKKSIIKNFLEIKKIISEGSYKIVHSHMNMMSFPTLIAAWLSGVKIRIAHSHGCIRGVKRPLKEKIYMKINKMFATSYAACSVDASKWLFGDNSKNNVKIIYNAIDCHKFKFDVNKRIAFRKEHGIEDNDICLLQVGRFADGKNHLFSLEILQKLNGSKYKLIFAGDGPTKAKIHEFVIQNNLSNKVVFLGNVKDVPKVMCGGDALLFPSEHEGFGMVAVEAQMCGAFVLASDAIPKDTQISDNIKYLPLNVSVWKDEVDKLDNKRERKSITDIRFDVQIQAKEYERYLDDLLEKE